MKSPLSRRAAGIGAAIAALGLAACLSRADAAPSPPLKATPDGRPLALSFDEEFASFRPWRDGHGVWRTTFRDGRSDDPFAIRTIKGNKEVELYVDPSFAPAGKPLGLDPFTLKGGMLEIAAERTPAPLVGELGGYRYVSGLITSQPSFSQTYGYFEMRAKLPHGKGVWPAFWLLPKDLSWPPEIDIMESVGDPSKVYFTLHSSVEKDPGLEVPIAPDEFHTFAVSWDPRTVAWFVDGREVKRLPTPSDMHKPMYLLANVALGGDWAGYPDASTPFPAKLTIDYIRAYRFAQ